MDSRVPLLLAGTLMISAANAGNAADPEIADPSEDAPHAFLDIVGVWFDAGETTLNITMSLGEAPRSPGLQTCTDVETDAAAVCEYIGLDAQYRVMFAVDDGALQGPYTAIAWFNNTAENWGLFVFTPSNDDGIAVPFAVGETDLQWQIPLALVEIPQQRSAPITITQVRSTASLAWCPGPSGCLGIGVDDGTPPAPNGTHDTAPDTGYGADYNLTYTPPAPEPAPEPIPEPTPEPTAEPAPAPQSEPEATTGPGEPAQQAATDGSSFPLQHDAPGPGALLAALGLGWAARRARRT